MSTSHDLNAEVPMLTLANAETGYGRQPILKGLDLEVRRGEMVALIGHNGAGKSTALKSAFGILPLWRGRLLIDGLQLQAPTPRRLLASGFAFVPQGHRIFPSLTVREHLLLASNAVEIEARTLRSGTQAPNHRYDKKVLSLLPELSDLMSRRAGALSGGERQIVAIAMALARGPRCLLLDEPTLGLAPRLADRLLGRITDWVRGGLLGVLVAEQKVRQILALADRVVVLRNGRISYSGSTTPLRRSEELLRKAYI